MNNEPSYQTENISDTEKRITANQVEVTETTAESEKISWRQKLKGLLSRNALKTTAVVMTGAAVAGIGGEVVKSADIPEQNSSVINTDTANLPKGEPISPEGIVPMDAGPITSVQANQDPGAYSTPEQLIPVVSPMLDPNVLPGSAVGSEITAPGATPVDENLRYIPPTELTPPSYPYDMQPPVTPPEGNFAPPMTPDQINGPIVPPTQSGPIN